jgi:hypothetical protein
MANFYSYRTDQKGVTLEFDSYIHGITGQGFQFMKRIGRRTYFSRERYSSYDDAIISLRRELVAFQRVITLVEHLRLEHTPVIWADVFNAIDPPRDKFSQEISITKIK